MSNWRNCNHNLLAYGTLASNGILYCKGNNISSGSYISMLCIPCVSCAAISEFPFICCDSVDIKQGTVGPEISRRINTSRTGNKFGLRSRAYINCLLYGIAATIEIKYDQGNCIVSRFCIHMFRILSRRVIVYSRSRIAEIPEPVIDWSASVLCRNIMEMRFPILTVLIVSKVGSWCICYCHI